MAESTMNPLASSPTNDQGIMQIHKGFDLYGEAIYDPKFNIEIAAKFYWRGKDFLPWSTYKSGAYLQYL